MIAQYRHGQHSDGISSIQFNTFSIQIITLAEDNEIKWRVIILSLTGKKTDVFFYLTRYLLNVQYSFEEEELV